MIPEAVTTSMSQVVPHLYIKTVFLNMGIKLYNKLPEKIKILHTFNNFKKELKSKCFLYCRRIFPGSIVIAVCIGKWGN